MKRVPHWGPKNIRSSCKKFIHPELLTPAICPSLAFWKSGYYFDELCGTFAVTGVTWRVISSLFNNWLFCLSLSTSTFRIVLLFFCYSLSLLSCLYICVLHCWCRHTGRQSCMTLPSELYTVLECVLTRNNTLLFCATWAIPNDRFSPRVKGII